MQGLDREIFSKLKSSIGSSPTLLKLAINLIMSYELNNELQEHIKNQLKQNNLLYKLFNDEIELYDYQNSHDNLMKQFFKTDLKNIFYDEPISWQIQLRIIEIKNLNATLNQNVYCVVQIGDNEFRTKTRLVDKLQFNNGDDSQVKTKYNFKLAR